MVVDSSALAAVLFGEEDAGLYLQALSRPGRKFISALTLLEISIVVEARKGRKGGVLLRELLNTAGVETVAFDSSLAEIALEAWRSWGRSRHQAALNLGDCAAYALSRGLNKPLLFKGQDFSQTDVLSYRLE